MIEEAILSPLFRDEFVYSGKLVFFSLVKY